MQRMLDNSQTFGSRHPIVFDNTHKICLTKYCIRHTDELIFYLNNMA